MFCFKLYKLDDNKKQVENYDPNMKLREKYYLGISSLDYIR